MKSKLLSLVALMGFMVSSYAVAVSVPMYLMGRGQLQTSVGIVLLGNDLFGNLSLTPNLKGLSPVLAPGNHMVVLYSGSCVDALNSPLNSDDYVDLGPTTDLKLSSDGTMTTSGRIKDVNLSNALNQALVIRGGDNGSGYHIVCGMVPSVAKSMLGSSQ